MDRTPSPITAALLESLRRLEFYQQHFQTSTSSPHLCSTCTQRCNVSTQAIITSLLQWQSWGFFKPLRCVESTSEVNRGLCVCVRAELLILGLLWTTLALQLRWTNRSGTDFNYYLFIFFTWFMMQSYSPNGQCRKKVKKRVQSGWSGWRRGSEMNCDRKCSVWFCLRTVCVDCVWGTLVCVCVCLFLVIKLLLLTSELS